MNKIFYPIFDGLDWIVAHKRIRFFFSWGCYCAIYGVMGRHINEWQAWVLVILLLTVHLVSYVEGRKDQEVFEEKWRNRNV